MVSEVKTTFTFSKVDVILIGGKEAQPDSCFSIQSGKEDLIYRAVTSPHAPFGISVKTACEE